MRTMRRSRVSRVWSYFLRRESVGHCSWLREEQETFYRGGSTGGCVRIGDGIVGCEASPTSKLNFARHPKRVPLPLLRSRVRVVRLRHGRSLAGVLSPSCATERSRLTDWVCPCCREQSLKTPEGREGMRRGEKRRRTRRGGGIGGRGGGGRAWAREEGMGPRPGLAAGYLVLRPAAL